jgi:hypothetical protein
MTIHITSSSNNHNLLMRLRRLARQRGFRILRDWQGTFSLVDTRIEPPRALGGLTHVPLAMIGEAVLTPLPPPKLRRAIKSVPKPGLKPGPKPMTVGELMATFGANGNASTNKREACHGF